jgi:hypothetical protein
MKPDTFRIYYRLLRAAMNAKTLTYGGLALELGLPSQGNRLGQVLAPILDDISSYEHSHGRPLLSALVIRSTRPGLPGPGFYKLATRLGLFAEGGDQRAFWEDQMERIREAWSAQ